MKKIITIFILILLFSQTAYAEEKSKDCPVCKPCLQNGEKILKYEYMFEEKNAPSTQVIITNYRNILCKGNAFKVYFDTPLLSECAKAGERVNFDVQEALYTREGTLLIPACSKVTAVIIKIQKQRFPNKNARVYLNFDCLILPDGTAIKMSASPLTKDCALKEGAWHTAGKIAASTIGLGIVGAGAGTGFAFIPNPAKLGVGFAIGIPVGCTVGLITGLLTPGVKYHAKEGEAVKIVLCENLSLSKCSCRQD